MCVGEEGQAMNEPQQLLMEAGALWPSNTGQREQPSGCSAEA